MQKVYFGKSLIEKLKYDGSRNPIDAAYLNCKIIMDHMFQFLNLWNVKKSYF